MRYAVGYQPPTSAENDIVSLVREFRSRIREVYFAWPGMASGRAPLGGPDECSQQSCQEQMVRDLQELHAMGVGLNLLLNANCYGGLALSRQLSNEVVSLVERISAFAAVDTVTTTSPFVAHVLKGRFPGLEVRASVNMRIGSLEGMAYLADIFDSFCVQREMNRDLAALDELSCWAQEHGKSITMLANSGCLYSCSNQSFHDNLLAHATEIAGAPPESDWNPYACWRYLAEKDNQLWWLRATWVRPEDSAHYEGLVSQLKLATRVHPSPGKVIDAYARQSFHGNLLDLMEPSHSILFRPYIIDNDRFPSDWFTRTSTCGRKCGSCNYCAEVMREVLVRQEELL